MSVVAERAGVSVATVSKVLHDHPDVGERTKRKVNRALRELNYVPVGRPIAPRIPTIVNAFDSFATVYAAAVFSGLMQHVTAAGIRAIADYSPTLHSDSTSADWVLRHAAAGASGAILVTSPITPALVDAARKHHFALVAIDPINEESASIATIGAANYAGAAQATGHLIELGHTRIGFAGLELNTEFSVERFAGFRSALERGGLPVVGEYIGYGGTAFENGQVIGARLTALAEPPTGIVAVSDGVALGFIEAARAKGYLCPDDFSIVGFDDVQPASWSTPLLTTVRQPLTEMGALAVRTLTDLIDGTAKSMPHLHLATSLVVRNSTRRADSR